MYAPTHDLSSLINAVKGQESQSFFGPEQSGGGMGVSLDPRLQTNFTGRAYF
jgi:hypothetical protein